MLTSSVSDIPYNWRCLRDQPRPSHERLLATQVQPFSDTERDIVLAVAQKSDLSAVRDWMVGNEIRCRIFGRWGWEVFDVSIVRNFLGARFAFDTTDDAALFRLSWASDNALYLGGYAETAPTWEMA